MTETEVRSVDIELRDDPEREGPGLLSGRLMRFGEVIKHQHGPEAFEPRSLRFSAEHGVTLYDGHDTFPRRPVSIVHPVQDEREARIEHRLPDTPAGRSVAARVRSGELKGLSVEFQAVKESRAAGVRRIAQANVVGLAVVRNPAYSAPVQVRSAAKGNKRRWYW